VGIVYTEANLKVSRDIDIRKKRKWKKPGQKYCTTHKEIKFSLFFIILFLCFHTEE